jgi:beta-galactosidase
MKYTGTIDHADACTVKTYCVADGMLTSPTMTYQFDMFINKSAWKVVSYDSQHGGNEARLAIDGNNSTFWHTDWGANEPACPHTIVIDMQKIYNVTAFTYLSRQDGNQNGMVKAYEVYLSLDGTTWGNPVASGEFKNTTALQVATLKTPTPGRYLKLVAKSEINNHKWTSAAEIGIKASADITAIHPITSEHAHLFTSAVYDLQGRRMKGEAASWPRGIYISNGRKVLK